MAKAVVSGLTVDTASKLYRLQVLAYSGLKTRSFGAKFLLELGTALLQVHVRS